MRLTAAGGPSGRPVDARSDALAWSLLAPLEPAPAGTAGRGHGHVERLLTAGLVDVRVEPPTTDAARYCIGAYLAEIGERFAEDFDPAPPTGTAEPTS